MLLVTAVRALITLVDELFRLTDDAWLVVILLVTAVNALTTLVEELFRLTDDA